MRELTAFDHRALVVELSRFVGRAFQKMSRLHRGYKIKLRGADIIFLGDRLYPTSSTSKYYNNIRIWGLFS